MQEVGVVVGAWGRGSLACSGMQDVRISRKINYVEIKKNKKRMHEGRKAEN